MASLVTITGPYPRPCGHKSFPPGFKAEVTEERRNWLEVLPCDMCRIAGWIPTEEQIKTIVAARRSEGRPIPKEYQSY